MLSCPCGDDGLGAMCGVCRDNEDSVDIGVRDELFDRRECQRNSMGTRFRLCFLQRPFLKRHDFNIPHGLHRRKDSAFRKLTEANYSKTKLVRVGHRLFHRP
jgi:hypothetical protein